MKLTRKEVKDRLKLFLMDSVQSTCGSTHLALKYAIDGVEIVEGKFMHRLTGISVNAIRKERQGKTIRRQREIATSYKELKERMKHYADCRFGTESNELIDDIQSEIL